MELHIFYTILHLIGVAIGAGGAFMSDVMFMASVKDKKINETEFRFLQTGSTFVWVGLSVLLISGLLIFSTNPEMYLHSDKFLSKMTIVILLTINGIFFHKWHMPAIKNHKGRNFSEMKHLTKARSALVVSGTISIISWVFALVLGGWQGIPFTYWEIINFYLWVIFIALIASRFMFRKKFCL